MASSRNSLPVLDDVTGALESLAAVLDREDDFRVLLQQVCRQVTRAVPGADAATVTLARDGEHETVAATGDDVADLDRTQYRQRCGPCIEAADSGLLATATLAGTRDKWPDFAGAAEEIGYASFLSAPMVMDNEYGGAINCYGRQQHGFAELDAQLLELYTTAVEAALRTHRRYEEARGLAGQLRTALRSRAVIDQAKGILMAARGVSADDAFALLVEQSQRENVKLRELASRFVDNIMRGG